MKNLICFIFLMISLNYNALMAQNTTVDLGYNLYDPLMSAFTNHEISGSANINRFLTISLHAGFTTPESNTSVYCRIGHDIENHTVRGGHLRTGMDYYPLQHIKEYSQNILLGAQYFGSYADEKGINTYWNPNEELHVQTFTHGLLARVGGLFKITEWLRLEAAINIPLILERDRFLVPSCTTYQPGLGTWMYPVRFDLILKYRIVSN